MKRVFISIISLLLIYSTSFAQANNTTNSGINAAYDFFSIYPGSMKLLNFYVEYASGDLSGLAKNPNAKRMMENFDTKLTYLQSLKSIPWLAFGFTLQTQFDKPSLYDPTWKEGSRPGKNTSNPISMVDLGANVTFFNAITLALSSSGDATLTIFWNKRLPNVPAFKSHTFTILAKNAVFIRGNQYQFDEATQQKKLTQGWYSGSEFRVAYQMRFNDYFAFRPELQFSILSSAQTDFKNSYWIRFNPRLQFFLEEWTLFVEPRIFYAEMFKSDLSSAGLSYSEFNRNGWAFEMKVGIDFTKIFLD